MKSKSIESVTTYERRNKSLKRKIIPNKRNRIESVSKKREKGKDRERLRSEGPPP